MTKPVSLSRRAGRWLRTLSLAVAGAAALERRCLGWRDAFAGQPREDRP